MIATRTTRIPPTIYKAVADEAAPKQRPSSAKAAPKPRQWPQPAPKPEKRRLPLDQRILSYPLWYLRWACLKASWALGILNLPSWLAYEAARKVNWVGQNYGKIRSFAIAHAAGPVRRRTWDTRAKACFDNCPHYYKTDGESYCRGDNGGRGCGCGHWRLARLGNKLSLSGWRCPIGNFDYGWLGRVARRTVRLFLRSASDG